MTKRVNDGVLQEVRALLVEKGLMLRAKHHLQGLWAESCVNARLVWVVALRNGKQRRGRVTFEDWVAGQDGGQRTALVEVAIETADVF